MNLTDLEDKVANSRYGKIEMKMYWILFVLLLIIVVMILGQVL